VCGLPGRPSGKGVCRVSDKHNSGSRRERVDRAAAMRAEREATQQRRSRIITIAIVAAVLLVVAVATFAISRATTEEPEPAAAGPAPSGVTTEGGVLYTQADAAANGAKVTGSEEGGDPVPVVLYEDFQCPACGAFEASVGPYLEEQVAAGKITVEYRVINFLDERFGTSYSLNTANAAACTVDDVGVPAWKRLHDALYANQAEEGSPGPLQGDLIQMAVGSGGRNVSACITAGSYENWVNSVTDQAVDADVSGTPTVLVDGEVVQGAEEGTVPGQADLQAAIDAAAS
jgi:protein-disulfide isomerase